MNASSTRKDVIVVTGAAAGVGRAIVERFPKDSFKFGLISRDREALEALAAEIRAQGAECASAAIDVSNSDAVNAAADRFKHELGAISLWINDAMLTVFSPFHDMTPEEYRRVTEVTYLGAVHGCMAALRHMRSRDEGHIINIGSALAYRGIPLQSAYCGAKHAIRGFTASLRAELYHDRSNIAVSIIELPAMNTPQFDWARTHMPNTPRPMGTIYDPKVAAEAVYRAWRKRPREYWVGVSTFLTIVGNMVSPGFLDRYLGRVCVEGQETDRPVSPDREDNLFKPITALHQTRGSFGASAKATAMILSGSLARYAVIAAGALVFLLLGLFLGAVWIA